MKVKALDVEFALHKIYLCQSPYFASMFGGSWLETGKSYIEIDIIDPLISTECKYFFKKLFAYICESSMNQRLAGSDLVQRVPTLICYSV